MARKGGVCEDAYLKSRGMACPAFQALMPGRYARPPSLGAAGLEVIETQLLQAGDADKKSVSIDAEPLHDDLRLRKVRVLVAMGVQIQ